MPKMNNFQMGDRLRLKNCSEQVIEKNNLNVRSIKFFIEKNASFR